MKFDIDDYTHIRYKYGKYVARMFMKAWQQNDTYKLKQLLKEFKI